MSDAADMPPDPFGPTPLRPRPRVPGRYVVDVEAVPTNIDSPELALWCDSCLLPSAVGYGFRVLANGALIGKEFTLIICRDCGGHVRRDDA